MNCIIPIGATIHNCLSSNQSVKVTIENPAVKKRDTWSMEITFPLSIPENLAVFGRIDRIDVTRRKAQFSNCTLYAGGARIITGTGIVTYISNTEARMQIVAGNDEFRIADAGSQLYIDRIFYTEDLGENPFDGFHSLQTMEKSQFEQRMETMLPYAYFAPVANDTDVRNVPHFFPSNNQLRVGFLDASLQPNLWFAVKKVLAAIGYELRLSWTDPSTESVVQSEAYRLFPHIYICNAKYLPWMYGTWLNPLANDPIARALPHWTAAQFIKEVESLFNITFVFDPEKHIATIADNGTVETEDIAVDCDDEFTAEYDDEGIKTISSSNIAYNLSDAHAPGTVLSEDILERFSVLEFGSKLAAIDSWVAMQSDTNVLLTTIWKYPGGYFFTATAYDEANNTTSYYRKDAGQLQPLKREGGDDSTVSINIAPVAMAYAAFEVNGHTFHQNIPIMQGDSEGASDTVYSVEMAVEEESDPDEDVAERIEVFILGPIDEIKYDDDPDGQYKLSIRHPYTFINSGYYGSDEVDRSLAIDRDYTANTIGSLHGSARSVEGHIRHTFRFIYHGMPDPKKVYIIRGKRFLCEKIEVTVNDDRIDDLKTGYFFEML